MKRQNLKIIFDETKTIKKQKIARRVHTFRNYTHAYNVAVLKVFNPELQLENTEFAIKNKLKNLLIELIGFKFVITLILKLKKTLKEDETKCSAFIHTRKRKHLFTTQTLVVYLNQSRV